MCGEVVRGLWEVLGASVCPNSTLLLRNEAMTCMPSLGTFGSVGVSGRQLPGFTWRQVGGKGNLFPKFIVDDFVLNSDWNGSKHNSEG